MYDEDQKSVSVTVHANARSTFPTYQSIGAAGADLAACILSSIILKPGERAIIPTGLKLQIPPGFEAQVRPRSGLAVKFGITCLNSPGTIDSDYRGELGVLLVNLGDQNFEINNGDRIAQLVIAPVTRAIFTSSSVLESTERGEGGFGSTGK